jgi:hypothetical protein
MSPGKIEGTAPRPHLVLLVPFLLAASLLTAGCSSQPTCPAGLHPYKDKCFTNMAIQYVGCTEGKGIDVITEIGGGAGGTFKDVADISLDLAYKRMELENTPVALQIVKDCLDIAKNNSPPDDPEQLAASEFQRKIINETPNVTISPGSAKERGQVTVTGSRFWPTEMVDIYVHASLVAQVQADENGAFTAVITVPSSAPPPGFPTTISAAGQSSAKTALAPFQVAP